MSNKIKLNSEQSLIYEWNSSFEFIYTGKTINLSENAKKIITDNWKRFITKNSHFFNGTVISLDTITQCGKKIKLEFAKTDYAHFIASEMGLLPNQQLRRRASGYVVLIRWLQSALIPFVTTHSVGVLNPPHE